MAEGGIGIGDSVSVVVRRAFNPTPYYIAIFLIAVVVILLIVILRRRRRS